MAICPFRAYRTFFGVPNKGIHRFKFLRTSIIDYVFTLISAIITTWLFNIPLVLSTVIWFVLGTICHVLFGVETELVKYLGLSCS